jgi:fructokinase
MTGPVVVAGEALVDLVPRADGALVPMLGGGPFNTARALGRLGRPAAFLGCISQDRFGRQLAEALAEAGVALDATLRTDRPTSLALPELDDEGRATYRFYMSGASAEALTPAVALAALPRQVGALHVGALGLVLEPLATAVEALVQRLSGEALVMVDPNVRPALIGDRNAYVERVRRVTARADIVKASDEDLRLLYPDLTPRDAAQRLLELGPQLVLLTLGAEGAVAFGSFGALEAAAPSVTVADTIGAGDIFSAAWLAQWATGRSGLTETAAVSAATHFACAAAALSCTRSGAAAPTREEVTAFTRAN